jgi:hypothetical protein
VFTSESGEWKLGGFDILSSMKEDDAIIYVGYPGSSCFNNLRWRVSSGIRHTTSVRLCMESV